MDTGTDPQNKLKKSRKKQSIKIKADIVEFEHTHTQTVEQINYSKNWFFENL